MKRYTTTLHWNNTKNSGIHLVRIDSYNTNFRNENITFILVRSYNKEHHITSFENRLSKFKLEETELLVDII